MLSPPFNRELRLYYHRKSRLSTLSAIIFRKIFLPLVSFTSICDNDGINSKEVAICFGLKSEHCGKLLDINLNNLLLMPLALRNPQWVAGKQESESQTMKRSIALLTFFLCQLDICWKKVWKMSILHVFVTIFFDSLQNKNLPLMMGRLCMTIKSFSLFWIARIRFL